MKPTGKHRAQPNLQTVKKERAAALAAGLKSDLMTIVQSIGFRTDRPGSMR